MFEHSRLPLTGIWHRSPLEWFTEDAGITKQSASVRDTKNYFPLVDDAKQIGYKRERRQVKSGRIVFAASLDPDKPEKYSGCFGRTV